MKIKIISIIIVIITLMTIGCNYSTYSEKVEDEIKLEIQLNLDKDIGLLLTEWYVNGQKGMSGTANADGSMIKAHSTDAWSIERKALDNPTDIVDLNLTFIIVTEYFEPNYEFDYPEECMFSTNTIFMKAEFGKTYYITIIGNNVDGYKLIVNGVNE